MNPIEKARGMVLDQLARVQWLAPLFGRLGVGLLFLLDGWAKLHNLPAVTQYFEELKIPAPGFNAAFVASTQLVCGALLVVGLLTRLAAVPLIICMCMAILTAKLKDLTSLYAFVGFDEFTYVVVLAMIAIIGPGKVSLDQLLVQKWMPSAGAGPAKDEASR
jgi:putative oxidoreductase